MSRNFVSEADAAIALDLALRVESGHLRRAAAFNLLTTTYQFAPHTANAYLNCYPHLRRGTPWKATVSVNAVRVMLETIATGGANDLLTALQSVKVTWNTLLVVAKHLSLYKPYSKSSSCSSHIRLKFFSPNLILRVEYVHRLWMIPHFDASGWRSPQKTKTFRTYRPRLLSQR